MEFLYVFLSLFNFVIKKNRFTLEGMGMRMIFYILDK